MALGPVAALQLGRPSTAALAACLMLLLGWSSAQMESPLKGAGLPQLETDKVFISAYLDRLLTVDEDQYRWQGVFYFFNAWRDDSAHPTVLNNTARMLTQGYQCQNYCSNILEKTLCCDNIFIPSFFFKNAYGFSQDREVLFNIYTADDGSVLREVRVQGEFYQPMSFQNFPFDSFDLMVDLRFFDPTTIFNTTEIYGVPHPGIQVVPSSGGKKLFTYGQGDDTSSWAVTDFEIVPYTVDMGSWFDEFSDVQSSPEDPMPLAPNAEVKAALGCDTAEGRSCNVYSGVNDQLIAVVLTIERFWRPALINSVLPVLLVAFLSMLVFCIPPRELATRLEVVVTLFLALTAVQFVLSDTLPTSSYVVPTQQLVLATYMLLFLLAVESIVVHHIVERHAKKQDAQRRKEAWRRYKKLRARGALEGGANPPLSDADTFPCSLSLDPRHADEQGACNGDSTNGKASPADSAAAAAAAAEAGAAGTAAGCGAFSIFGGRFKRDAKARAAPARVTSLRQLTADEAFGEHVGHWVDNVSAAVLGVAFVVCAILIFTLQSGYVNVFE